MDFMKQIWPQIVSSIITASIIAVGVTIWQTATNGGLISFLSGATVSELEQVSGELEELKEQTDRHIRNLVDVRTTHILVRTRGRGPDPSWPDVTYIAPHLPAGPAVYTLGDLASLWSGVRSCGRLARNRHQPPYQRLLVLDGCQRHRR